MSTYTPIASVTLAADVASINISGIPQTYTDLVVVVTGYQTGGADNSLGLWFNGDTGSNYSWTRILGSGSSAISGRGTNTVEMDLGMIGGYGTRAISNSIFHIMNYSNTTTYKTALGRGNMADGYLGAAVGLWRNTSAVTSINIGTSGGNNMKSGATVNLYGIASGSPKAFGGDIVTTDGTYYYHTFLSSGTFTPAQNLSVDYLVVAGGGGGSFGGGGSGGLRCTVGATGGGGSLESKASLSNTVAYAITIGAGGVGGFATTIAATNGSNSSISGTGLTTITSTGGGYGGGQSNNYTAANSGGSGGGSGHGTGSSGAVVNQYGAGTNNQGYAGGSGYENPYYTGGGGGGAGAVGSNSTTSTGGNGGAGVATSISGSSVTYAGGGGGAYQGSGGSGGGGAGSANSGTTNGTSGSANTGGGGGGSNRSAPNVGTSGNGGSGIVIIRYLK
mgnify:CR=1 FL=1